MNTEVITSARQCARTLNCYFLRAPAFRRQELSSLRLERRREFAASGTESSVSTRIALESSSAGKGAILLKSREPSANGAASN